MTLIRNSILTSVPTCAYAIPSRLYSGPASRRREEEIFLLVV